MASNTTSALLTRADLDNFPDDGSRYELVDGELLVSPLAKRAHQLVVGQIYRRLADWADHHGGRAHPGVNVDHGSTSHLEPDVAWAADEDATGLGFTRTPELVAEVLSTATRVFDRTVKLDRYAATGAVEIWLVDLEDGAVEVYRVAEGVAGEPTTHRRGDTFTSALFDGLVLDVDDLVG